MTTQEITALTIAGGAGQSIGGTQVSLMAANSSMSFIYRQSNLTWYRNSAPALGNVGTAPVYAARAWVNFNGTGTVAIRASGNVSSITDNATGDYTVNFATAMPDVNYILSGSAALTTTSAAPRFLAPVGTNGVTAGSCQIRVADDTGTNNDCAMVSVAIHR